MDGLQQSAQSVDVGGLVLFDQIASLGKGLKPSKTEAKETIRAKSRPNRFVTEASSAERIVGSLSQDQMTFKNHQSRSKRRLLHNNNIFIPNHMMYEIKPIENIQTKFPVLRKQNTQKAIDERSREPSLPSSAVKNRKIKNTLRYSLYSESKFSDEHRYENSIEKGSNSRLKQIGIKDSNIIFSGRYIENNLDCNSKQSDTVIRFSREISKNRNEKEKKLNSRWQND